MWSRLYVSLLSIVLFRSTYFYMVQNLIHIITIHLGCLCVHNISIYLFICFFFFFFFFSYFGCLRGQEECLYQTISVCFLVLLIRSSESARMFQQDRFRVPNQCVTWFALVAPKQDQMVIAITVSPSYLQVHQSMLGRIVVLDYTSVCFFFMLIRFQESV